MPPRSARSTPRWRWVSGAAAKRRRGCRGHCHHQGDRGRRRRTVVPAELPLPPLDAMFVPRWSRTSTITLQHLRLCQCSRTQQLQNLRLNGIGKGQRPILRRPAPAMNLVDRGPRDAARLFRHPARPVTTPIYYEKLFSETNLRVPRSSSKWRRPGRHADCRRASTMSTSSSPSREHRHESPRRTEHRSRHLRGHSQRVCST